MRIRDIVTIFTICIIGVLFFSENNLKNNSETVVDMVSLNNVYKRVEEDIEKGIKVDKIEKKYQCKLVFLNDENYESLVNDAISEKCIIKDYYDGKKIVGKIIFNGLGDNYNKLITEVIHKERIIVTSVLFSGYLFIFLIYFYLVRPFNKLQKFARDVSSGNLDVPISINKVNYFGAFTESFDLMREELKKAREAEYKANISKKELVASLSHDIKTPVATIEAICEVLEVKYKDDDILEKVQIISKKAEVIDKLISNMFHATLEELQNLSIERKEEASIIILDMFNEINNFNKIHFKNEIPSCLIYADKLRLNQVIDNIVNNSYKYANTDIDVSFKDENDGISISITDYGVGVKKEEIPLLTEKYYRGDNIDGKSGSGLGLFLAKLFMNGMGGELECYSENGFTVVLYLKKV